MITASGNPANLPNIRHDCYADWQREFLEEEWLAILGGPETTDAPLRRWHNPDFAIVDLLRRSAC
jgi:hypothetical protein